jgi:hypothetical protein
VNGNPIPVPDNVDVVSDNLVDFWRGREKCPILAFHFEEYSTADGDGIVYILSTLLST